MNIYDYLNSKTIREYWEKIGYTCNSLESAWIIYHCNHISMKERHRTWMELIDTMPDCEIPERRNIDYHPSLHQFLRGIIKQEQALYDAFCSIEDGAVYTYRSALDSYSECFSTFEKCQEDIKETYDKGEVSWIHVKKMYVDQKKESSIVSLNKNFEVVNIDHFEPLQGLWFDFPHPFQKGDTVYNPNYAEKYPLVIKHCGYCGTEESRGYFADESDMSGIGYTVSDDGRFYHKHLYPTYLDYEYYTGKLNGAAESLDALQLYYLGKTDEISFAILYERNVSSRRSPENRDDDFDEESEINYGPFHTWEEALEFLNR